MQLKYFFFSIEWTNHTIILSSNYVKDVGCKINNVDSNIVYVHYNYNLMGKKTTSR